MYSCATDVDGFESVGGLEVETTLGSVFALLLLLVVLVALSELILTISLSLSLERLDKDKWCLIFFF